jgi:hypothetical protein
MLAANLIKTSCVRTVQNRHYKKYKVVLEPQGQPTFLLRKTLPKTFPARHTKVYKIRTLPMTVLSTKFTIFRDQTSQDY